MQVTDLRISLFLGNTHKYGLIFHSTFIGRASQKNKVYPQFCVFWCEYIHTLYIYVCIFTHKV